MALSSLVSIEEGLNSKTRQRSSRRIGGQNPEFNHLFKKDRGKTASAARVLSPNPKRQPLPCLLIKSFFYGFHLYCCSKFHKNICQTCSTQSRTMITLKSCERTVLYRRKLNFPHLIYDTSFSSILTEWWQKQCGKAWMIRDFLHYQFAHFHTFLQKKWRTIKYLSYCIAKCILLHTTAYYCTIH